MGDANVVSHVEWRHWALILLLYLAAVFSCPVAQAQTAEDREIRAVIMKDMAPSSFLDKRTNEPSGFAVELLNSLAGKLGLSVSYVAVGDWKEVERLLITGQADVCPVMAVTEARKQFLSFTDFTESHGITINVRAENQDIKGIGDLSNRDVAVIRASQSYDAVKNYTGIKFQEYDSFEVAFFDLVAGHVDAFVVPTYIISNLAHETGLEDRIRTLEPPLREFKRAIAVRSDLQPLYTKFNQIVPGVISSTEYHALYMKWFGRPSYYWTGARVAMVVGGLLLILVLSLAAMAFWRHFDMARLNRRLAESEQKYREIFNASTEAIFINELPSGRMIDVNESMLRMYGFDTKEEVLSGSIGAISADVPPYTQDVAMAYIEKTMTEGPQVFEWLARKKSGESFWVEVALRQSLIGGQDCVLAVVRDITERKKAESERADMERRMQHIQKLESLGVLAGGIAHDFNNLLLAILGNANLAAADIAETSPAQLYLAEIEKATQRAADLCKQMLAYSGRGRFVIKKIHLPDVAMEIVHLLKSSISRRAALNLDISGRIPLIQGDPTQIRQIIMNLITNASEAIGDEDGVITLTTGLVHCSREYLAQTICDEGVHPGEFVYLEVTDTGCGMDEATLSRIFEPFFTTKFTGRGLGMAAVLGIIRGHQGAIVINSSPGRGSTFRVLFPAIEAPIQTPKPVEAAIPVAEWRRSGGVLLVEDEESNREIARKMLERIGFTVYLAADGFEALEIYNTRRSDIELVVLDLTMPKMSGEEVYEEIRRMDPNLKVVISSGYTEHEIEQRFEGKDIAGFVVKPYSLATLENVLRRVYETKDV